MFKCQIIHKTDDYFLPPVIQWLCGLLSALLAGGLCAWLLVPFAYSQRGYKAVGGEWMVVFVVSFTAFQICIWLLDNR